MADPIIQLEREQRILFIRMNNRKANAINKELLTAFEPVFQYIEADKDISTIVITGYDRFFSAGLDLVELYEYDRAQMQAFIALFQKICLKLFALPLPLVAAMNGHTIAGGAILALTADARIMVDGEGRFGLNEILLGLPLPVIAMNIFRHAVTSPSVQSYALFSGAIFTPKQALELKLVDEIIKPDEFKSRTLEIASSWANQSVSVLKEMKTLLRAPAIDAMQKEMNTREDRFLDFWFSKPTRKKIGEIRNNILSKNSPQKA